MKKKDFKRNNIIILMVMFSFINWVFLLLNDYTNEKIVKRLGIYGDYEEYKNVVAHIRVINYLTDYLFLVIIRLTIV